MSANSELNNYLKAIRNFPYHVGSYDAALPEKKCGEGDTHGQACFRDGWQSAVEAINERITEMQGSGNASGFTGDMEVLARLMAKDGYRLSRGTWNGPDGEQLPTVCIDRPDTPAWNGVWSVWDEAEGDNEASTAFRLYSSAVDKWAKNQGERTEIEELRHALKVTTDALVHAFCWGDSPVPFEEIEGGRWDGVRGIAEMNEELLREGTSLWRDHIGDANKKVDRTSADGPHCHRRLVRLVPISEDPPKNDEEYLVRICKSGVQDEAFTVALWVDGWWFPDAGDSECVTHWADISHLSLSNVELTRGADENQSKGNQT